MKRQAIKENIGLKAKQFKKNKGIKKTTIALGIASVSGTIFYLTDKIIKIRRKKRRNMKNKIENLAKVFSQNLSTKKLKKLFQKIQTRVEAQVS